ncbi:MAG: cysteine--tRNA ligase, partial [Pseudomonadota bacterium]
MMLKIYDTASRSFQTFTPYDSNRVRLYCCGPTVYDDIHIGNARPVVVFDVLFRLLQILYPEVIYVRNITDIEDKIIARAQALGCDIGELCARTTARFQSDCNALCCLPPVHEPRASNYIGQMIRLIQRLLDRGVAYEAEGHLLFSVADWPDYGRFARQSMDAMQAGARVEIAPYKRDALDFVLWKPSAPELPGWDSPWGRGRPGWHIECSAMSHELLGGQFDLHCGGQDLIFPHHQNEIAQSCAAWPGEGFAKYWMHNGYLLVDGRKMSKSLGNFHTVRELLGKASGQALRLSLLQTQYRQPLDFTVQRLGDATRLLGQLYDRCRPDFYGADEYRSFSIEGDLLLAPLLNDLNTPLAVMNLTRTLRDKPLGKHDEDMQFRIARLCWVLGLL